MLDQLKCVLNFFLKKLFNNLNTYNQIEYFINLLFNKLFKNDSIYNISHNKFAAIKNYLNNIFKKKFDFQTIKLIRRYYLSKK